jgi:hypothetical protein
MRSARGAYYPFGMVSNKKEGSFWCFNLKLVAPVQYYRACYQRKKTKDKKIG